MFDSRNVSCTSRRRFLAQSLSAVFFAPLQDVADHGIVRPSIALPELTLTRQDGSTATLQSIVSHRVTALQLMFTNCTTTCPMQGATFERVQRLLGDVPNRDIQLVSLSVDPKADTPRALRRWLQQFHAGSGWVAAVPGVPDLAAVKTFFGVGRDALDPHSTQTNIIDRSGRLVYRTGELAPPEEIASLLKRVSNSPGGA